MASDVAENLEHLNHRNWAVRAEAIRSLEVLDDSSAASAIAERLQDDDSVFVRMAAARALGVLGTEGEVPALTAALSDEAFHVRQSAIWSLGRLGALAESALPELERFTESPERFPQAELTVAELAQLAIDEINHAVEEARVAAEAAAQAAAEAEAAAEAQAAAATDAPPEPAAEAVETTAAEAPAEEVSGSLTDEQRLALRKAALEAKRARDKERGRA
jgi:HEAT repeat protein